jgi:ATP-dependent Clp protease ATP-binding subunit ClpC
MVFSHHLLNALQQEVVGHEYAVAALTRAITIALTRMRAPNRPIAALLFAGPAGSGKTHVARSLARVIFGDEGSVIYVNCQQVSQAKDPLVNLSQQLLGGYSQLAIRPWLPAAPFVILVFEEIDKATAQLRDDLAAAIERGALLTGGLVFPLHNTLMIMTTTLTKKQADQIIGRTIGFFSEGESDNETREIHVLALEEMDRILGPHLVGRSDEVILFERLTAQHLELLLDRKLAGVEKYLASLGIGFAVNTSARSFLLERGVEDMAHGVRQINRAVKNLVEFPIADLMLSGRLTPATSVLASHDPPRGFLNFQITIPFILPASVPVQNPLELGPESV